MANIENITVNPELPLSSRLKKFKAYGAPVVDVELKMNTNENPYQLPEEVKTEILAALALELPDLNRYPDRLQGELRIEIAKYLSKITQVPINSNQVWAANGSNEILNQILLAFYDPGVKAIGFTPSYSMHQILSEQNGYQYVNIQRKSDFSIDLALALEKIQSENPRIIFITSPNNPTGNVMKQYELLEILKISKNSIIIFDEAYGEFSSEPSAINLIAQYPQLIVTRTMSKAFAFAGARVGYAIAQAETLAALGLVRLPYHLSTQTQVLAKVALRNYEVLQMQVQQIIKDRKFMQEALEKMGLSVIPSDANFFLFGRFKSSQKAFEALLKVSILVRDVGIDGFLRATVPTTTQAHLFIKELGALLDNREIELS